MLYCCWPFFLLRNKNFFFRCVVFYTIFLRTSTLAQGMSIREKNSTVTYNNFYKSFIPHSEIHAYLKIYQEERSYR